MSFTPLERLGLEVAAERLLCGNRGLGRLLAALLLANGKVVTYPALYEARVTEHPTGEPSGRSVAVRVCLLRSHLDDVGLSKVIKTHWGEGYSISEPARSQVIDALLEAA